MVLGVHAVGRVAIYLLSFIGLFANGSMMNCSEATSPRVYLRESR